MHQVFLLLESCRPSGLENKTYKVTIYAEGGGGGREMVTHSYILISVSQLSNTEIGFPLSTSQYCIQFTCNCIMQIC